MGSELRISVSLLRTELRISVTLRPTAVSCETVDRCIASLTVGCFRSMPHAGLMLYTSFFCGVDYDRLLFLFLHAAFFICDFCAFCVWTYGFVSLYVSEFLTAACGVSPLRGRPALSKAKGLDPNAF